MDAQTTITARLAEELAVRPAQIAATVELLDGGATVPFIARYRKEVTGGLDDGQLRQLEERLRYLRELEERRAAVLASIDEQGKLSDALAAQIREADTKQRLEDLYLPYKKKRRTKAQIAREAGLEPLADTLLADPTRDPESEAQAYLRPAEGDMPGVEDTKAALDGAKQILMERFAEDAELVGRLRDRLWEEGELCARVVDGKQREGAKFADYFEHDERLARVPSHRALAMFRGRNEGVLSLTLKLPGEDEAAVHPAEVAIARHAGIDLAGESAGRPADRWLREVVRWTWRVKLYTHLETELLGRLRERAEGEAIDVFAANLKDLLLAAPAGPHATLAIDPGLRTGCKVAVVDATGQFLEQAVIYPHAPQNRWDEALAVLGKLVDKHGVTLIAIGNGTASRETDRLAGELLKRLSAPATSGARRPTKVMVSEAGASVYSASELASRELPELDVTIRGAVSIARRLQDPLAELVKIEPKSIGVGQYQHDVSQVQLSRSLEAVIEDCVNAVGVDLNTASGALLSRVSGLNPGLAENIVARRNSQGAFRNRRELLEVSRLGPRTFEQCAGFLRIMNGDNPLDASAVHPEAYPVVARIAERGGRELASVIGDSGFLKSLSPGDYVDDAFGVPTITDILKELDKPGRDPRPEFKAAEFREGVETLKDLEPGMILEGSVTNVTHFGAFVDIGVHQDGLVHISALSDSFVDDPRQVVKAGDIVKVKVMSVDVERGRIGLSMRLHDQPEGDTAAKPSGGDSQGQARRGKAKRRGGNASGGQTQGGQMGALGEALLKARDKSR
ncbi:MULTISPECIES: Tex family protein [unclassified Modicisalibacter]|uniref:Tex family protein n=1 Tax=unclassified Modicisalibacter TaxID=2679913 RepID=UPI001CCC9C46|nr:MULTISPECIES: Tex family protein [unclassified Modicisalibacter]MBZ9557527.1 RNA-binding transcriptional accessory protein [Modicisalibacter sp. R2A 31.J]MBZ9573808.1 RNA-binding transcriptional accessory protein [Modicisalibacter sp. MOD 31.J]